MLENVFSKCSRLVKFLADCWMPAKTWLVLQGNVYPFLEEFKYTNNKEEEYECPSISILPLIVSAFPNLKRLILGEPVLVKTKAPTLLPSSAALLTQGCPLLRSLTLVWACPSSTLKGIAFLSLYSLSEPSLPSLLSLSLSLSLTHHSLV